MTSTNIQVKVLCIYCFKPATQSNQSQNPIEVNKQFLNLISRHLNLKTKSQSSQFLGESPSKPCRDCLGILTNFCKVYHQIKSLELQLLWQVDKIWNVMRWADRVPSRLKEFRNSDDFERKLEFRKIFKGKCKQNFSNQAPRVSLSASRPFSELLKTEIPACTFVRGQQDKVITEVESTELSIENAIRSNHNEHVERQKTNTNEYLELVPQNILEPQPHRSPSFSLISENHCDDIGSNVGGLDSEKSPDYCLSNNNELEDEENSYSGPNIEISDVKLISNSSPNSTFDSVPVLPASLSSLVPSQNRVLPELYENVKESLVSSRRSLRTKFQCSNCKRTFSNENRFKVHISSCSQSTETESETTDTDDGDEMEVKIKTEMNKRSCRIMNRRLNDDRTILNSELSNTSSFSSGESELEDSLKPKGNQTRTQRRNLYSCSKCPNKLFNSKLHQIYKHSKGRLNLNADSVQRMKLSLSSLKLDGISLESHKCTLDPDQCSREFPLSKELEKHIKLHGNFTCPICNLCFTYALDLIDHELEHSDDKQLSDNKTFQKGEIFHCARCDYKTVLNDEIVNHFLNEHFGLPEIEAKCPICQQLFPNNDTVPLTHYVNYHDLNRLDDVKEKNSCTEFGCTAYFLTEDQLHVHWNREHRSTEMKAAVRKKSARKKNYVRKQSLKDKHISCPHCPKKFHHQTFLRQHILGQHLKESGFRDAEVTKGDRIITKDGLTVDDIVLEKNAKFFCKVDTCKEKFRNDEDFQSHSKLHGNFPCNFCDTVHIFATDLAIHETVHVTVAEDKKCSNPQQMKFRCSRCPFLNGRKERYVDHFVWQHLGLMVDKKKCPICKHAFPFYCGVSTGMAHEFRRRIYQHFIEWHDFTGVDGGEQGALECDKCPAYFRTDLQLMQHTDEVHTSPCNNVDYVESSICDGCGMNFKNNKALREHRRKVHKVELKFACSVPECDKKFETSKELIYHHTHFHFGDTTGERKFKCEKCGKKYFSKIALLSHIKSHDSSGTHVCEQCGKCFKFKFKLKYHYKFHTGPESWEFACEICGKKISSKQKLTDHMRVHTKEKPFVCQVCGMAYGHRHNLRIHVNSKHQEIQDVPRKVDTTNFASTRKGKKLK